VSAGRVLALDPGEKRIGVALSDPGGVVAHPHATIDRTGTDVSVALRELCREHGVERIVVGLPLTLGGEEGRGAAAARRLAHLAREATGLDVELLDERFTTAIAEAALLEGSVRRRRRRELRDRVAAAVLLQAYLDRRNARGGGEEASHDGT